MSKNMRAVVAIIRDQGKLLAIKRSAHVIAPGKICFPGGRIENNESEQQALVREIQEELGVEIRPLEKVWQNESPWGYTVSWYTAEMISSELVVDTNEVEWARWLTLEEFTSCPDLLDNNAAFFDALKDGKTQMN